jgi:hypothetical protein
MGAALDRLVVKLAQVEVSRYLRLKGGHVEDVDPYTYRRAIVGKRGARALVREGGFSLSRNGHEPKGGFMVAIPGNEEVLDAGEVGTQALGEYMSRHRSALNKPGAYLGGWVDHETRKVYLDVAENVTSEDEARRRGKERGEIAIYDIGGNQEVRLARGHEGHTLVFLPKDDPAEAARLLKEALGERPA